MSVEGAPRAGDQPALSIAWILASIDDWTDEEMQAVNVCVSRMLGTGAPTASDGRPGSLIASALMGELIVGVVWRGGSAARFGYGWLCEVGSEATS